MPANAIVLVDDAVWRKLSSSESESPIQSLLDWHCPGAIWDRALTSWLDAVRLYVFHPAWRPARVGHPLPVIARITREGTRTPYGFQMNEHNGNVIFRFRREHWPELVDAAEGAVMAGQFSLAHVLIEKPVQRFAPAGQLLSYQADHKIIDARVWDPWRPTVPSEQMFLPVAVLIPPAASGPARGHDPADLPDSRDALGRTWREREPLL